MKIALLALVVSLSSGYVAHRLAMHRNWNAHFWALLGLLLGPFSLPFLCSPGRWTKRVLVGLLALVTLVVTSGMLLYPAVAAYSCPACFGFVRVNDRIFVNAEMTEVQRAGIEADYAIAVQRVGQFYRSFAHRPVVLACSTAKCDRRLGGRGAAARAFGSTFIHVSPRGINAVILAHEFSHIELHARVGLRRLSSFPAWFDEGLAVIVSDDARYLKPGETGAARCTEEPSDNLPVGMFEWARVAGRTSGLYASAACKVLRLMDANGGRDGLIAAVDDFTNGKRGLP